MALSRLPDVPGSLEMIERCHYDPVNGRWIDEWQPIASPKNGLAQTLRCYTPADLLLLLEGTGLRLEHVEIGDKSINPITNEILPSAELFSKDYNYLVQLAHSEPM
jgi:hypothetical protein